MDDKIFDQIHDVDLKKTMENSYIDYAMSVIASRALPDVRDGLKPVQRRVLYSMIELNNGPDKPHRKCARIVGDTMGKYHPHGDSSIYGALVNMAQDWSTRYPLVDGHGNFGSVDGDGAAAMRYTEARLSKVAMTMLKDIDKDTVDFVPNFDETEKEPVVLPSRIPNLLVNGTQGIAVGMATNIPPHNLREVVAAIEKMIDNRVNENRDTDLEEIMEIIKGPDFPTGGEILGKSGIESAYKTGRGKIKVRAVTEIEPMQNGKNRIIVTELPYMVNKARLIKYIADLQKNKKIDGITELRDETSREGMRIVIELRRDINPTIMLNKLFKHTQLQDTFGVIMLALVNNQPKVLNLKEILKFYLKHQEEVVYRRTKYDLNKKEERAHILKGLLIALDNIDKVIAIIRGSENVQVAKASLMKEFGLSDAQAQAIVDMRLRALTNLERGKIETEYNQLLKEIEELKAILSDNNLLLSVIKKEIHEIAEKYSDERKSSIGFDENDITVEDMIPNTNAIVTFTKLGYIKRMAEDTFKAQNRGGKGIKGMETIDNDYIVELLMTKTHDNFLFFTTKGRVYKLKTYQIPEASRTARGTNIVNILQLQPDEKISSMIPIKNMEDDEYLIMATKNGIIKRTKLSEYGNIRKNGLTAIRLREDDKLIMVKKNMEDDEYLIMATKNGIIKRTKLSEYGNIRKNGLTAIRLREDDKLIMVKKTSGKEDVMLCTKFGQCIRFKETDVRSTGRDSIGVIGISLYDEDEVISMQITSEGDSIILVSKKGLGKCTKISEFAVQRRGGKGVKCYRILEKTGNLTGVKTVHQDDEMMIITTEGTIIRIRICDTALSGRVTSGVKLINLKDNEEVASIEIVREEK